jgi:aspartyl-tRNA(Asn)/glutamyl-tRNA(Gln) amidotransferase subunit C
MEINHETIEKLSSLSKLAFNDSEKAEILKDLQNMLSFVDKLNEVDTAGVAPLLHISAAKNVFRADEVKVEITKEDGLMNAKLKDEHFFKVPKVIRK